jgi:hypothetical protein
MGAVAGFTAESGRPKFDRFVSVTGKQCARQAFYRKTRNSILSAGGGWRSPFHCYFT